MTGVHEFDGRMRSRMTMRSVGFSLVLGAGLLAALPADAQESTTTRVVGRVLDEANAVPLPGIPVEVSGRGEVVYTDLDGRYMLQLPAGTHELKVSMEGYQPEAIRVTVTGERTMTVDVSLTMARFADTVTVTATFVTAETSSAAAQLIERKNAQVITDNIGSQEMRQNGDSDAAGAMSRVTGLSVVDNQFVFVRGLGERYSNTTLAGAVLPTTEPDKKVVPLDLFPSGLLDSIQVNKSYSPDRSAEFAGGLVQIVPTKLPDRPLADFSYGVSYYTTATGKDILLSPLGDRDWLGYDNGARALPAAFPDQKIVRRGLFTPEFGFSPEEITTFGRLLENRWVPQTASGAPGQNWSFSYGNRFGRVGLIASATHSYKEQYVEEQRRFFRVGDGDELDAISDYSMRIGTQKAQLGVVGNVAYEVSPSHRLSVENFYSHSGRDEGRFFEGPNTDNNFYYRNNRLQFIEEELFSNALGGEHFFRDLANSRIDWRVNYARAKRDEPDLRETLYQATLPLAATPVFNLADEAQSGFRQFSNLDDDTTDVTANWSIYSTAGSRPSQFKFGASYVDRDRNFAARRFRFIPVILNKDGAPQVGLTLPPEEQYTSTNIGRAFRFNEETQPRDAYEGDQQTTSGYGMVDVSFSASTRLVAGARVERFTQAVHTFDPFGVSLRQITAENENTDVFPSANLVQALAENMNLRLSYSATVNRPEFRELAEFEFTDVVGARAVRGNPDLDRALIQNVDGRWEAFMGARGILAASVFYKYFDQPIERVVLAAVQPIVTFQNADKARNFGLELEAGHEIGPDVFVNLNCTYVDSKITLRPEQRTVQTSLERPLAGQSKNLFNVMGEYTKRGFSTRVLFNYAGDRISDVGANDAPDIVEQGRGSLDLVFSQRIGRMGLRLNVDNVTDSEDLFTQGVEEQRVYKLGRTVGFSVSYSLF
jgi:hypothetical protein